MNYIRYLFKYNYYKTIEHNNTFLLNENEKLKNIIKQKKDNSDDEFVECFSELNIDNKPKPKKKKNIPKTLKKVVWNKYIGEEKGNSKCLCCKVTTINQMSFHCGHIISEFNGGEINLENLKPICPSCNLSMKTENMNDFIKRMKF